MTQLRQVAVFHLVVAAATAVAVGSIFLLTRQVRPALAGFAVLSLLAVPQLRSGRKATLEDERDAAIQRRAALFSYTIFWVCFVIWGVAVTLRFGSQGAVPIEWVEPVVWVAAWLVVVTRAAATVTLDARGW